MAYSINCHAILLLQMVRLYITPLCIYRDPAHPLRVHLQGPFEGDALTLLEQRMSQVRVAVERVFGDITLLLCLLGLKKKNLQIGLSPVGKMYIVCSLLRNGHACLYHSSTSEFFDFGIDPPAIRDYFV